MLTSILQGLGTSQGISLSFHSIGRGQLAGRIKSNGPIPGTGSTLRSLDANTPAAAKAGTLHGALWANVAMPKCGKPTAKPRLAALVSMSGLGRKSRERPHEKARRSGAKSRVHHRPAGDTWETDGRIPRGEHERIMRPRVRPNYRSGPFGRLA
jgi:hypothetical protein